MKAKPNIFTDPKKIKKAIRAIDPEEIRMRLRDVSIWLARLVDFRANIETDSIIADAFTADGLDERIRDAKRIIEAYEREIFSATREVRVQSIRVQSHSGFFFHEIELHEEDEILFRLSRDVP